MTVGHATIHIGGRADVDHRRLGDRRPVFRPMFKSNRCAKPIQFTMNILVNAQKGGVGKTTLAVHLAVYLAERGATVGILDTDNQAAAAAWGREALPQAEVAATTDAGKIGRVMQRCRDSKMILIVDSQPGLGDAALTAVRNADAILVPMNPAPLDWRATVQGLKVYDQQAEHNRKPPVVRLIINRRETAAAIHREVEELARAHPTGCLKSSLSKRTAIEKASGMGTVVWRLDREAGARAAAQEMSEAFDEFILAIKQTRRSDKSAAADQPAPATLQQEATDEFRQVA